MKITANKVSALVFTVIAIAAFAWMTMRPSIDAQATGFGLSSQIASTSTATTTTAPPKDTETPSETETTDKDSTSNTIPEEKDTKKPEKESDKKIEEEAEEKSADDQTPDDAKQNTDSPADTTNPSADDASTKQDNEEQSTEPTTPEAPTAPTAPTSPVAPSTSDNTDDQTDNKKKNNTEEELTEKTSQTDGVETTDLTTKTEESDQKIESAIATTAAVATTSAVIAQSKTDEASSAEIYTQADHARGTVVILSGCDYKPNPEGGIIATLHKILPQKGWNTLSFQLPNLSNTSTFKDLEAVMPEATKNIESSIAMAKEKSDTPIILFAHGCGSQMALAWMEAKGNDSIDAYIGLGTGIMNNDPKDTDHLRIPLEAMKFPQLDILGSADHATVLKTAAERLGHINRASNPASRQKIILDADHNMTGKEDILAKVIAKWLDKKAFKK